MFVDVKCDIEIWRNRIHWGFHHHEPWPCWPNWDSRRPERAFPTCGDDGPKFGNDHRCLEDFFFKFENTWNRLAKRLWVEAYYRATIEECFLCNWLRFNSQQFTLNRELRLFFWMFFRLWLRKSHWFRKAEINTLGLVVFNVRYCNSWRWDTQIVQKDPELRSLMIRLHEHGLF